MERECEDSFDCLDNATAVRFCYENAVFSDETFFCDCSNWFGWKGLNCDETTPVLYLNRISSFLIVIWCVLLVIATGRTLFYNFLLESNPTGVDPVQFTGVFILFASVTLAISQIITLNALFNPDAFEVVDYTTAIVEYGADVTRKGDIFSAISLSFSSMFFIYSCLTVMLSWNRVISKTARFTSQAWQQKVKNGTSILKILGLITTAILVILCALELYLALIFYTFILSILLAVGYLTIGRLFVKTVLGVDTPKNEYVKLILKLVLQSYRIYSIILVLNSISLLLFAVTLINYAENQVIGGFNYSLFFRELSTVLVLILLTHISWYVNSVTEGVALVERGRCTSFWSHWDKQNEHLIDASDITSDIEK